jgi:hypothetical protein
MPTLDPECGRGARRAPTRSSAGCRTEETFAEQSPSGGQVQVEAASESPADLSRALRGAGTTPAAPWAGPPSPTLTTAAGTCVRGWPGPPLGGGWCCTRSSTTPSGQWLGLLIGSAACLLTAQREQHAIHLLRHQPRTSCHSCAVSSPASRMAPQAQLCMAAEGMCACMPPISHTHTLPHSGG